MKKQILTKDKFSQIYYCFNLSSEYDKTHRINLLKKLRGNKERKFEQDFEADDDISAYISLVISVAAMS